MNHQTEHEYFTSWDFVFDALRGFKRSKREYKTYLVSGSNGLIKIGKTIDVNKRIKVLQSINPEIKIIACCDKDVELELHEKYSKKRIQSEWFSLTKDDIDEIMNNYEFHN